MEINSLRKKQILDVCQSLLKDYKNFLTDNEIIKVKEIITDFEKTVNLEIKKETLLPIVEKIWNIELNSGEYIVISWNKYFDTKKDYNVVFATLCKKDDIVSFCHLRDGIQYEISYKSIIGAFYKDAATLIESIDKKNKYTIATIDDKVINSYNGATKLITPKQVLDTKDNDYPSKHNELILDARYIKEVGPFNLRF